MLRKLPAKLGHLFQRKLTSTQIDFFTYQPRHFGEDKNKKQKQDYLYCMTAGAIEGSKCVFVYVFFVL